MKQLFTIILALTIIGARAQENQAITGANWKDGSYMQYENTKGSVSYSLVELEKVGEVDIQFKKDENGLLRSITVYDKEFVGDKYEESKFIRYFTCEWSNWDLFVMDDSKIIILNDCNRNPDQFISLRVLGSFGGKLKKFDRDKIIKYLKNTIDIQKADIAAHEEEMAKYDFTTRAKAGDVENIEIKILTKEELKTGVVLEFGFIVTLNDGIVLKTKNLGGNIDVSDLTPYHKEYTYPNGMYSYMHKIGYCEDESDGKVKIIIPFNKSTKTFEIEIECEPDPKIAQHKKEAEELKKEQAKLEAQRKQYEQNDEKLLAARKAEVTKYKASQKGNLPLVKTDDLYYFNVLKKIEYPDDLGHQLAVLKDGDNFVVLSATGLFRDTYETYSVGYYLRICDKDGNTLKTGEKVYHAGKWTRSSSYSQFEKTDFGYMVVNPEGIFYFDNNLQSIGNSKIKDDYGILKAVNLKDSDLTLVLGMDKETNLDLFFYNYKKHSWLSSNEYKVKVYQNFGNISVKSRSNEFGLFETLDGNILVVASGIGDEEGGGRNYFNAYFKYDLSKILSGDSENAKIFYHQFNTTELVNLILEEDGLLHGLAYTETYEYKGNYYNAIFFTLDPTMNSSAGFEKSLNTRIYSNVDNPISYPKYFKKIGKYYYVFGNGNPIRGHGVSLVALFNSDYELVGYNRLKNEIYEEVAFERRLVQNGPRISDVYTKGSAAYFGSVEIPGTSYIEETDAWEKLYYAQSFDMEHITGSKFMILEDDVLKIVDLNGGDKCELSTGIVSLEWLERKKERYDNSTVYEDDYQQNSTSNKSSNSSSSSKKEEAKTCTIINDLSASQVSKYNNVQLVFDNYRISSKSISRGEEMEVDCDDVVVWHGVDGSNSSKKVKKLFSTKGKCGQTIRLSEFW